MSQSPARAAAPSTAKNGGRPSPPDPSGSGARRSIGISLASRLAATVLVVGSVSLIVATIVGLQAGQSLGRTIVHDRLELNRSSGTSDVAAQAKYYQRLAEQLAAGPTASDALEGFAAAFGELSSIPASQTQAQRQELLEVYGERYIEPLRATGEVVQLSDIVTDDPAAVYLQATYSLPEAPITDPIAVNDANDGSDWTDVHALVHPTYRSAVVQAGLRDVYLIDASSDRIVYTASKGPDLGTSLVVGPYSGSIVSRAADAAIDSDDGVITDLDFYRAVPGVPLGAAAAAIRDGDELLGVVVLTYDADVYTERLNAVYEATTGEGRAGDLYMMGSDGTTRSDPQAFLADPEGFLDASSAAGLLTPAARDEIELNGTTVLVQPAADPAVGATAGAAAGAAVDGETEIVTGMNMTGGEVIGAGTRIPLDDVEWYTVAEIDVAAAESTIASFRRILLVGAAVFVVVLAFVAVAWARRIMAPVRVISNRLGRTALAHATDSPVEPLSIPDRSPIEFHELADSFMAMGHELRHQQQVLRDARAERLRVLEGMVPAPVAQRIARGDVQSLDQVPSVTVVVIVVSGIGALAGSGSSSDNRHLLDELHAQLDDIAFEHGLDRIKVVGDSYFGACGHDRPYLDHAPRVVAFAEHVAGAVRALSRESSVPLDTAIGINTGTVTVGMSAGTRLLYDVWGPTVTVAHVLARGARAGEIVVTDSTRARLPEDVRLTRRHVDTPRAHEGPAGGPDAGLWTVVVAPDDADIPARPEGRA